MLALLYNVAAAKETSENKYGISVRVDHDDSIYKQGEEVTFTIEVLENDQPAKGITLECLLTVDTARVISKRSIQYNAKAVQVSTTLDEPGFVRCKVSFKPDQGKLIYKNAAVGFDPLSIKPSLPVPDDFKAFWDAQKKKLAETKMEVIEMKAVEKNNFIEVFDMKISSLGEKPVSGYFARPLNGKKKTLPAMLWTHGGGVRSSIIGRAKNGANMGCLSMDINAHGLPNGKPAEFYAELNRGALAGYRTAGREDRNQVYFKLMFLRLVRAIDFLTSQPEWDGKNVIVRGHSQGGSQALIAAGLDDRVTIIGAGIPALCDHSGMVLNRIVGWPRMVPIQGSVPDKTVLQVARYFDVVNFAPFIKADTIMSVGFIDDSCKPTTVYAAYNQIKSNKLIVNMTDQGHRVAPIATTAFSKWFNNHLGE